MDKRVHTFPKGISPKKNVIVCLKFELTMMLLSRTLAPTTLGPPQAVMVVRKWIWPPKFKTWMRLFIFHFAIMHLGKAWILVFSPQLWVYICINSYNYYCKTTRVVPLTETSLDNVSGVRQDFRAEASLPQNQSTPTFIIIKSCRQHGYPWPSLATSPFHSSHLAGLQGYIPYPHIAAVCMFELVVLLLLGYMRGP